MTIIGSPWDIELEIDGTDVRPARPEWFGRLVDLHVLTLHGDDEAALEMARWSADDPVVAALSQQLDHAHRVTLQS